jgi:hypothetical protein
LAVRHATGSGRASVADSGFDLPRFRAMWMTVEFTNVYDGGEHIRRDRVEVDNPPVDTDDVDEWLEWAEENLRPHTGDGKAESKAAGYFAAITVCTDRPELVGREFDWGC